MATKHPHKKTERKHVEEREERPQAEETDGEEMSESEANAMFERAEERKEAAEREAMDEVDGQDWTRNDPVIPEELLKARKVWVAVFKCPKGHKTKATNRQADSGVYCYECKEKGEKVRADIMDQFVERPEAEENKDVKRKAQRRASGI